MTIRALERVQFVYTRKWRLRCQTIPYQRARQSILPQA
jgi:hypothetical protein